MVSREMKKLFEGELKVEANNILPLPTRIEIFNNSCKQFDEVKLAILHGSLADPKLGHIQEYKDFLTGKNPKTENEIRTYFHHEESYEDIDWALVVDDRISDGDKDVLHEKILSEFSTTLEKRKLGGPWIDFRKECVYRESEFQKILNQQYKVKQVLKSPDNIKVSFKGKQTGALIWTKPAISLDCVRHAIDGKNISITFKPLYALNHVMADIIETDRGVITYEHNLSDSFKTLLHDYRTLAGKPRKITEHIDNYMTYNQSIKEILKLKKKDPMYNLATVQLMIAEEIKKSKYKV